MALREYVKKINQGWNDYFNPSTEPGSGRRKPIGKELLAAVRAKLLLESDYFAEFPFFKRHTLFEITIIANNDAANRQLAGLRNLYSPLEINSNFARGIETLRLENIAVSPQFHVQVNPVQEGFTSYLQDGAPFEIVLNFTNEAAPEQRQTISNPLKVIIVRGNGSSEHMVTALPCTLGRSGTAAVPITDSEWVSRGHLTFSLGENKTVIIRDESKNGTFIDGKDMNRSFISLQPDSRVTFELGYGRVGGEVTEAIIAENKTSGDRDQFPRIEVSYGNPKQDAATPDPLLRTGMKSNGTPDPIRRSPATPFNVRG